MPNDDDKDNLEERSNASAANEFESLQKVIAALTPFTEEVRRRILDSAALFLQVSSHTRSQGLSSRNIESRSPSSQPSPFSEDTSMSPKEFLLEKQPRTDVERIATLAYYLTHYRGMPHFKTIDLSMLNTEAAQPKFANTAYSSNNAVKLGYLVPSTKGQRQLSAIGERFVRALPDREAAKTALEALRRKPRSKRSRLNANNEDA